MPRVNHCKNKGCKKPFYDSFKKSFCPECEEEFARSGKLPGEGEAVPVPPSPGAYDPIQPRTWVIKKKKD